VADFTTSAPDFTATEITVEAVTATARELLGELFGAGARSVTLPKSQGPRFAEYVEAHGLTIR
jgi:hypothetical protein